MEDASVLFSTLEARGEKQVRVELAQGIWSEPRTVTLIREWLALKDRAQAAEDSAKRDAREEETLSIAKDALAVAKDAKRIASEDLAAARSGAAAARAQARWAMWAAIIAVTAAVIATKEQILALIFTAS